MDSSSFQNNQTSPLISSDDETAMEEILNNLPEGPDDVLVVSREKFLEVVGNLFAEIPFVALNLSRTRCTDKDDQGRAHGAVSVAAVGFESEYIKDVPAFMQEITGVEGFTLSTDDDAIDQLLRESFSDLPGFVPAGEEPTAPQEKTILSF